MTQAKQSFLEARRVRKQARTALYAAVYGRQEWDAKQGPRSNLPWRDPSRRRPQDWHPQDALSTVIHYREAANLDRTAAVEVASALQVTPAEVMA